MLVLPIIVMIMSIVGMFFLKKLSVIPLLIFVVFTILIFTVFNKSFCIWVVIYTVISVIISLIIKFVRK
nr:DUF2651 family protein [Bacillus sp. FJAT-49711]